MRAGLLIRASTLSGLGIIGWLIASGCASSGTSSSTRGPDGTIAYSVEIESSEPGARIEVNNDYVGHAPLTITVYGDPDGTFHNFGSMHYVIRAFPTDPTSTNLFPQTKAFRTGGWFSDEDAIPKRIYFDMRQRGFSISSPP